jgi:hypothetical protein
MTIRLVADLLSFSSRDAALPLLSLCLFAYLTLSRGTDTDYPTMLSLTSEKTGRENTVRLRSYLTIEESSLLNTCKSNVKGLLKMGRVNRHPANQSKPFRFESQTIRSS